MLLIFPDYICAIHHVYPGEKMAVLCATVLVTVSNMKETVCTQTDTVRDFILTTTEET